MHRPIAYGWRVTRCLVILCVISRGAWSAPDSTSSSSAPAKTGGSKSVGASTDSGGAKTTQSSQDLAGTGFSIESEVLTYACLEKAAGSIVSRLQNTNDVREGDGIVIANDDDASAFLEWRVAMGQIQILGKNTAGILQRTDEILKRSIGEKERAVGTDVIASGAALAGNHLAGGILTAAAGIFAATESQVSVRGTVEDAALVNITAGKLVNLGLIVYVPNAYPPGAFGRSGLRGTMLVDGLERLARDRAMLETASQSLSNALQRARALKDSKNSSESAVAQDFERLATPQLAAMAGATAAIDAIDARVFGAPVPAPQGQQAPGKGASQDTPSAPLPRLLRADLLAQRLGLTVADDDPQPARGHPSLHVLVLKALESGGTVMVKDSFFRTAYSYSGGSISSFALYSLHDGRLETAGIAYAHAGFVKENAIDKGIDVIKPLVGPVGSAPAVAPRQN